MIDRTNHYTVVYLPARALIFDFSRYLVTYQTELSDYCYDWGVLCDKKVPQNKSYVKEKIKNDFMFLKESMKEQSTKISLDLFYFFPKEPEKLIYPDIFCDSEKFVAWYRKQAQKTFSPLIITDFLFLLDGEKYMGFFSAKDCGELREIFQDRFV